MISASLRTNLRATITPWRYHILLVFSAFTGGWASILGRMAQTEAIPTVYIILFRQLVGALLLTPFVLRYYRVELKGLRRREITFAAAGGIWFGLSLLCGFEGLKHTSVLVNNVLGGTTPLWIALIEVLVLKNRLNRWVWTGLLISLCGGIIIALSGNIVNLGNNPGIGILLAIGAAVTGSLYAIVGRESRKHLSFLPYIWMVFIFAAITTLPIMLITHTAIGGYSAAGYVDLILLTLLPQLIGHLTYNFVLRRLSATLTAVISQLGTVVSIILALFIFSEVPATQQVIGGSIVIAGIILVNLREQGSKIPSADQDIGLIELDA